jgi:hypothetical protein
MSKEKERIRYFSLDRDERRMLGLDMKIRFII